MIRISSVLSRRWLFEHHIIIDIQAFVWPTLFILANQHMYYIVYKIYIIYMRINFLRLHLSVVLLFFMDINYTILATIALFCASCSLFQIQMYSSLRRTVHTGMFDKQQHNTEERRETSRSKKKKLWLENGFNCHLE